MAGTYPSTLTSELNRLANGGASYPSRDQYKTATAAANAWAGTSGLELLGALNTKAGNTRPAWFGLWRVCNQLAGTSGLSAVDALRTMAS